MKKLISITLMAMVAVAIGFLIYLDSSRTKEKTGSSLASATQAAFVKLDARIAKCTPAEFQLEYKDDGKPYAPLFEDMGDFHFKVTTSSEKAQIFFDQGLKLTYAFNHAEAHRSFMEAARLDPQCAMAWWGAAFALGPNINDAVPDPERKAKSYEAVQKAVDLAGNASKKEKAMINALADRYGKGDYDLEAYNKQYMESMAKVAGKYGEDADIQTLYAAAIMNTMPWNYWDLQGNPNMGTLDGKTALETAMEADPDHPGAHHYYIHMVELPDPDLAVPSADKLGSLMPAAGHLVHMPSHIYIRVGRYEDAVKANIAAVAADEDYISQCLAQGIYPLAYYPHNIHFLWSAASLMGDSETAIMAGKKTAEKVPLNQLNSLTFLQDYYSTPYLAYLRFGKWNEILTIPAPGEEFKHVSLIWHYARGIAFLRKKNLSDAKEELEAIREIGKDPGLESLIANYTNPSSLIYDVAVKVLDGEISAYGEDYERAIELLEEGVAAEDKLNYSEPSAWHIPVRQTLGSILLKAGEPEKAEAVYRKDLEINRNNGWSLTGLRNSLVIQGKAEEANQVRETLLKVWSKADIQITDSVL